MDNDEMTTMTKARTGVLVVQSKGVSVNQAGGLLHRRPGDVGLWEQRTSSETAYRGSSKLRELIG